MIVELRRKSCRPSCMLIEVSLQLGWIGACLPDTAAMLQVVVELKQEPARLLE